MDYRTAHAELLKTPDGTPGESTPLFPGGASRRWICTELMSDAAPTRAKRIRSAASTATIRRRCRVRVTRPGFIQGIAALAASDDRVPHLPSIERWRDGRSQGAVRSQCRREPAGDAQLRLRAMPRRVLLRHEGDAVLSLGQRPQGRADRSRRTKSTSSRTARRSTISNMARPGAKVYKAQHPEFELWSQGVHARSGVSCADCHMPYERQGAMKVSSHWVRSPLLEHQQRLPDVPQRAGGRAARQSGNDPGPHEVADRAGRHGDDRHARRDSRSARRPARRRSSSRRSSTCRGRRCGGSISSAAKTRMGFHADQEAVRILGESIDYSRQAQAAALRLRAPAPPAAEKPTLASRGRNADRASSARTASEADVSRRRS